MARGVAVAHGVASGRGIVCRVSEPDLPDLPVAVAQPRVHRGNLAATAREHALALASAGARLVVFPELSLTGYELDAEPVALDDPRWAILVEACARAGAVALVGAPVAVDDRLFIATVRVDGDGVSLAYRKSWLHGDEHRRFTPGDGPATTMVDGWVVGLAICKDTGASQHTAALAPLGVDLYAAGVVDVPADVVECRARAFVISRALGVPVLIASHAGGTGGGFTETAGRSVVVAADGSVLVEADEAVGRVVRATLVAST